MTRERAKELAPIIKAYGEGASIQWNDGVAGWFDFGKNEYPAWCDRIQYRIAPEPRRRPMTRDEVLNFLAEHPNVLVRVGDQPWQLSEPFSYNNPSRYSYCLVTDGVRSEPRKFEIEEGSE